jgi:hypothetical protein
MRIENDFNIIKIKNSILEVANNYHLDNESKISKAEKVYVSFSCMLIFGLVASGMSHYDFMSIGSSNIFMAALKILFTCCFVPFIVWVLFSCMVSMPIIGLIKTQKNRKKINKMIKDVVTNDKESVEKLSKSITYLLGIIRKNEREHMSSTGTRKQKKDKLEEKMFYLESVNGRLETYLKLVKGSIRNEETDENVAVFMVSNEEGILRIPISIKRKIEIVKESEYEETEERFIFYDDCVVLESEKR